MRDQATEAGRGAGFKEAGCLDTGKKFQDNPHINGRRGAATRRVMCWRIGVSIDAVRLLSWAVCCARAIFELLARFSISLFKETGSTDP